MSNEQITVLLVDDEEALLTSMQRRLQLRGFKVIIASRGQAALQAASEQHVDVAVIDMKMPGMSGRDLLLALKEKHPDMQVIVLTGHGTFDPGEELVADKIFSCLAKPCDFAVLKQTLLDASNKNKKQ